MIFSFLGAYDPAYPRNAVLRDGLGRIGVEVRECRLPASPKFWLRYPLGLLRFGRAAAGSDVVFVPEFCHKDVPLARLISSARGKRLIFDPLAGRYETKIVDWRRRKPGSLRAWWNFAIDRLSFGLSDLVLADTQAHADYFRRTYDLPAEKIAVLPVGYDDRLFRPSARSLRRPGGFRVLFFGSFLPLHGAENIVEAASLVAKKDPSVRFTLIGSGQTQGSARVRADCLGLENVNFEGWVKLENLPARIAAADVCLGIFGETEKAGRVVPHKVFQSLGMKKPVITARTPAAQEFFKHKKHVFFCDRPYPETLAAAILTLKRDSRLRREMAEEGCRLVEQKYSPRALGRRLVEILGSWEAGQSRGRT